MTAAAPDDLEVLAAASTSASYRGTQVCLEPVSIGRLPALVRVVRPMLASAQAIATAPSAAGGDAVAITDAMDIDITFDLLLGLIEDHADGLFEAVALLTGRDVEWIRGGDPAEFIELALAAVEVNRDFFTKRIAPLLGGRVKASLGVGQTPSSS